MSIVYKPQTENTRTHGEITELYAVVNKAIKIAEASHDNVDLIYGDITINVCCSHVAQVIREYDRIKAYDTMINNPHNVARNKNLPTRSTGLEIPE
jgi:putative ubiquitin-RnfH superfamily antitoxin RatB of RatAB toxin-antitoxin module